MRRPRGPRSRRARLMSVVSVVSVMALSLAPLSRSAEACGWDWESYHAEAKSLPCVFDALLGYWPKHTDAYHEIRIEAADYGLRWVPGWTEGLDAKGISLLKLGRLEQAEIVMKQRHALTPTAYAGHANLGTLYTFTGEFEQALEHIDAAMAIEPQAHFGREKYHRALVVYLARVAADPAIAKRENFLGLELSPYQRRSGSKATFRALELDEDSFDALVSMLTVYGADGLAEIYLSLGELLAARGHPRLAYTAYRRARTLGHPRKTELHTWMRQLTDGLRDDHHRAGGERYRGIKERYASQNRKAKEFQVEWAQWEHERLERGLAIWTQAGLDEVYARMHEKRRRCDAPRIITDTQAPLADHDDHDDSDDDADEEVER